MNVLFNLLTFAININVRTYYNSLFIYLSDSIIIYFILFLLLLADFFSSYGLYFFLHLVIFVKSLMFRILCFSILKFFLLIKMDEHVFPVGSFLKKSTGLLWGLPTWQRGKESTCKHAQDPRDKTKDP